MADFDGLPGEMRTTIYNLVADADSVFVPRKALPGKYICCSRHLLAFSSVASQHEYRQIIEGRIMEAQGAVTVRVKDFNFNNATKFLRVREGRGELAGLLENGPGQLIVSLSFTRDFDGSPDRAWKWMRFMAKLAKKHGSTVNTQYSVVSIPCTPGMLSMSTILTGRGEREPESEWEKITQVMIEAFIGRTPDIRNPTVEWRLMQDRLKIQEEEDREADQQARGLPREILEEDPVLDADGETDLPPIIEEESSEWDLHADREWAMELLGDAYHIKDAEPPAVPQAEDQDEDE